MMFRLKLLLILLAIAPVALALSQGTDAPLLPAKFTQIDVPGAHYTSLHYISNRGQIIGVSTGKVPEGTFLLSHGIFTRFHVPHAKMTWLTSINDWGQVIGSFYDAKDHIHGFLFSQGAYTTIDYPGMKHDTDLAGLNNHGQIIGNWGNSGFPERMVHGFLWSHGVFAALHTPDGVRGTLAIGLNGQGQIVGMYYDHRGSGHLFLRSQGVYTTLDYPGDYDTSPWLPHGDQGATVPKAINDRGQVLGEVLPAADLEGGGDFLWSQGIYTKIAFPGQGQTVATGLNNQGQVVGGYNEGPSKYYGSRFPQRVPGREHGFLMNP